MDDVTTRTAMENSNLPTALIDELIRQGKMTNNGLQVPFVQQINKPIYYTPGGNPETEIQNLFANATAQQTTINTLLANALHNNLRLLIYKQVESVVVLTIVT